MPQVGQHPTPPMQRSSPQSNWQLFECGCDSSGAGQVAAARSAQVTYTRAPVPFPSKLQQTRRQSWTDHEQRHHPILTSDLKYNKNNPQKIAKYSNMWKTISPAAAAHPPPSSPPRPSPSVSAPKARAGGSRVRYPPPPLPPPPASSSPLHPQPLSCHPHPMLQ